MNDKTINRLNDIYETYKDECDGMFHNALWQILVNESCEGAFVYIDTRNEVGVAQADGGFIPAMFGIPDQAGRDEVLAGLNRDVFGLLEVAVDNIVIKSLRNNGHPPIEQDVPIFLRKQAD